MEPRYQPRCTGLRRRDEQALFQGPGGFVASLLRQAIEDAAGMRPSKHDHVIFQAEARRWLRGRAWEPLVENLGADAARLRRELERRFDWMRESA